MSAGEVPGDPDRLRACARALGDLAGELEGAGARATSAAEAATARWTGRRSVDAGFAARGVTGQLAVAAAGVGEVAAALRDLAGALDEAQAGVRSAAADVRRAEVHAAHSVAGDPGHVERVRREAGERTDDARAAYLRAALAAAERIEAVTGSARRTARDADLDALGVRRVAAPAVVAAAWRVLAGWVQPDCAGAVPATDLRRLLGAGPAAVAHWWRSLDPHARLGLLRAWPAVVGNLDGLPGWARDLANRQRLVAVRADLRAQVDHWTQAHPTFPTRGGSLPASRMPGALAGRLRALDALAVVLSAPGRRLLTLDVVGGRRVRAAVAVGDVDTADDVAVLTPGFTSDVAGDIDQYVDDMSHLRDRMAALDRPDGQTAATVAWLGYDAPQWGELADPTHSVTHPAQAAAGGVLLAGFLRGIDAARSDGVHLTALGHSYGSTTTGYALARGRTGSDDVVLFGSPGVGSFSTSALRMPRGHLFDLDANGDPVGGTMVFGATPAHSSAFRHLETGDSTRGHWIAGHTSYLQPGSTSQWNIAAVAAGVPDAVVPAGTPVRPPPTGWTFVTDRR